MPIASVIMPCFNHARFLRDSANGILGQSEPDLELIIVDDCSSDDSWEIIQAIAKLDHRVKAIRHPRNEGASRSRNDGLRVAMGKFIGFCDADDIWERNKLRVQIELLQANTDYHVAYCDTVIVDENGLATGQRFSQRYAPPTNPCGRLFPELIRRNFINMQSVLLRKECVARVGSFDEGIKWVEDWWYWVKMSRHYQFLYSPEILAKYRVHRKSTNVMQKRGYCLNRYKVFKRVLRDFADLPGPAKAEIFYQMGCELYALGKGRAARHLFWDSIWAGGTDPRAFNILWRAAARMILAPCREHFQHAS
jgi:glycosyltransferase involved in cell wall biosynthesis